MQLDINRFLSDRVVYDDSCPEKLRVTNSVWDWCKRIVAWIWGSEENRRTVALFKKYLIDTLGPDRLQRICCRYSLDLDQMEKKESPLLSHHVAQILVGSRDVTVEDINASMKGKGSFQDLDRASLAALYKTLSTPLDAHWQVADIAGRISGRPTESIFRFDPFLSDRERQQLVREHPGDSLNVFIHHMVARVIKREMDVGTLVPAPNHSNGQAQFYYVSGKVVTGEGMVSYLLHPVTADTELPSLRLFRGTALKHCEIDAISTMITDIERDLGRSAYESGLIYEPRIIEKGMRPAIEVGHSLGATLVQYRLAHMDHIQKAYLFNGPGVPLQEVEKFNQKRKPVELVIRQSELDEDCLFGDAHLGYQAPPHVKVDLWRYSGPKKFPHSHHVAVWEKEKDIKYGVTRSFTPDQVDRHLFHQDRGWERARKTLAPAKMLRALRDLSRACMSCRAHEELGLKIGTMQSGRWRVDHFRPI